MPNVIRIGMHLLLSLLIVVNIQSCAAAPSPTPSPTPAPTPQGPDASSKSKKPKGKDFSEVVEDYEKVEGLFDVYFNEKEGKYLLAVRPDQLDKMFLCNITRQSGDAFVLDGSAMEGEYVFEFKRIGEDLQMINKNVWFRADKDAAFARAVEAHMPNSLVASSKILSLPRTDDGALLVDMSKYFIQDVGWIQFITERIGSRFRFDSGNSYFSSIKSFPENTEIGVTLHYETTRPNIHYTLPDPRSMFLKYHYSLSTLPESDFEPRLADDRIGHFVTFFQDYSSILRETPYVYYINRWHLEKSEPALAISKPKKPIVFWLENTIPMEFRDDVRDGVLLWNKAFERIGYRDAIEVKQMPDDADWDPADVRYNTIRWVMHPGGGTAVGPSRANPFTGEIYDADVRVQADWLRSMFNNFEYQVDPMSWTPGFSELDDKQTQIDSILAMIPWHRHDHTCRHAHGLARESNFGMTMLQARGEMIDKSELREFVRQYIIALVSHEVGHTLGFRHNFKGSTIHSLGELHNASLTDSTGMTGSVMEYSPVNLSPKGQPQGKYLQTTLGPYDYWVVEYAYSEVPPDAKFSEKQMLDSIIARVADEGLQYATDEDTYFTAARAIDPYSNVWDLGDDPIAYFKQRFAMSQELWAEIPAEFEVEGERYQRMRRAFGTGWGPYFFGPPSMAKFVGGIRHVRDHVGDPGDRKPFEIIPAEKQREALNTILDNVLAPGVFNFPPDLVNKLAPERLPDFFGSTWTMTRLDYPIRSVVQAAQAQAMLSLYSVARMNRILDNELRFPAGQKPFTLAEMYQSIDDAVWAELNTGAPIDAFRRELQRMHLLLLTSWLTAAPPAMPNDALTLTRFSLTKLQTRIEGALASTGAGDTYTQAHLQESLARIEAALDAQMQRN